MRHWLVGISIVGWSLWSIFNKLALRYIGTIQMQIVACGLGMILIPFYLLALSGQPNALSLSFNGIVFTVLASICATGAGIAYLFAIKDGELGTISVLSSSYPLLTLSLSVLLFNERITLAKMLGMLLVVLGVVILGR